jgi:hypothetical protein
VENLAHFLLVRGSALCVVLQSVSDPSSPPPPPTPYVWSA